MEDDVQEIDLQRSESLGFGFSIIGGAGSELPPVICDIVENSPAYWCEQVRLWFWRETRVCIGANLIHSLSQCQTFDSQLSDYGWKIGGHNIMSYRPIDLLGSLPEYQHPLSAKYTYMSLSVWTAEIMIVQSTAQDQLVEIGS